MRILITGSSGRVGSAIAELLAERHDLIGLDLVPGRYTTFIGSVADQALVRAAATGMHAIIHTASLHVPDLGRATSKAFVSVNVRGTRNLLDAAAEHEISRFVYSSTTSVYGRAMASPTHAVWVSETLEPQPRDIYDETKLSAERLCCEATRAQSVSCVSLRFSRCFPEPEPVLAAYRLYRGVDVRDVADAHRLALIASCATFEVYNISARSPFLPDDCPQVLTDARGVIRARYPQVAAAFSARGWPLPDSIDRVYAIDKAERHLGYQPRYNYLEFLRGAVYPDRRLK